MNYEPRSGWYYIDANRKSPSWTGVNFLYDFLVNNRGRGPFGVLAKPADLQVGDLIQLSLRGNGKFDHTQIITKLEPPFDSEHIFVTTHTYDMVNVKLTSYSWKEIRFIHILGSRN